MFVDISIAHIGYVILTVVLTSTLFALGGLLNGVFGKTFDDISIVPTFVLTPLTYLGGVFYSVSLLPEFWQNVSMANPILYMVNGFRYGFLGQSDVGIATAMWVLIAFNVVFFSGAYYLLEKGKGIRS
jgi:ABC-2 type transport system permease protein